MRARLALASLFLSVWVVAAARAEEPTPIAVRGGERIPLRDGVHLNATLYTPATPAEPLPVLVSLTPYISDRFHELAGTLARFGYVVALVDVRGRGSSEGEFDPFAQEAADGHDVVAWLARQPWSNGKVGMFGGSYGGYNQWAAAKERPPGLATIVPVASAHPGVDFPFAANVKYSYLIQWLALVSGKTPNPNLFGDQAYWTEVFRRLYRGKRPFRELDRLAGFPSGIFQRWLDHPTQGPYWDAMVPTPQQYRALDLPILSITGHYDGDQPGALAFYRNHLAAATPAARDRHFLIVGPWDHAGTRRPQASFGGWTFGPASLLDMVDLHRQWYAWTMGSGPRPEFLRDRVAVYVSGREAWRWAPSLEALAPTQRTLYLSSRDGAANDVFASGTLAETVPTAATPDRLIPDRLVYDPCDLSPLEHETPEEAGSYLTAQRRVLHLGREGVVYHSAPLTVPTELTGSPRVSLWLTADVPDTDLRASLYEILPDGRSFALTSDILRLRYRESLREATPMPLGRPVRVDFERFSFVSRELARGSRLRLVIDAVNSSAFEKNYNAGGVVAEESGADCRVANLAILHDTEHPSQLTLPIGP